MSSKPRLLAAGGLLWRTGPDALPQVALVHRPRYDDWSFPKGKPEHGESLPGTAVREIQEETGHRAVLGLRLADTSYQTGDGLKTVHYWAARDVGGEFIPNDEVDEMRWLAPENAAGLLSYRHDRELLGSVDIARLPAIRSVLLVRHAKAGKRDEWDRPDRERPLSAAGRRQAEGLRSLLSYLGAARLHSAPLARCVQTLEPYAKELGIAIEEEPHFSEEGYWAASESAVRRLQELAAADSSPVAVCSQGGVIPDLVRQLTTAAGLPGSEFPSRKGSVWVLSFSPTTTADDGLSLLQTDHYPDPFS